MKVWAASTFFALAIILIAVCAFSEAPASGVLAALVTMLIGWNIYSLVDFNERVKSIDKLKGDVEEKFRQFANIQSSIQEVTHDSISLLYANALGLYPEISKEYLFIYHAISALMHASIVGDINTCESICRTLLLNLSQLRQIGVSLQEKRGIEKLLDAVLHKEEIAPFYSTRDQLLNALAVKDHRSDTD